MIFDFRKPTIEMNDFPYSIVDAKGKGTADDPKRRYAFWVDTDTGECVAYKHPFRPDANGKLSEYTFFLPAPLKLVGASETLADQGVAMGLAPVGSMGGK